MLTTITVNTKAKAEKIIAALKKHNRNAWYEDFTTSYELTHSYVVFYRAK